VRRFGPAAAVAALLLAPGASGSSELIRPGKSIAGVALGMGEAEVRAKLGRPTYTIRRRAGFGRVELELQFDDADYRVRLTGRPRTLRAVAVSTILRKERTSDGMGVGTLERTVIARLGRTARCEALRTRQAGAYKVVSWEQTSRRCVARAPGGGETVWVTSPGSRRFNRVLRETEWLAAARVIEVEVRRAS
jgi:hypothetical protein